ncbi:MAG TPA: hypothetical protein VMG32_14880 [Anaeromyxobacteraceae bacterium]|nr:hypothetical protein [Anaeromyxobacteraceae bacterium]
MATASEQAMERGTAALGTERLLAVPELARAEALAPGEMRRVAFAGELLGAARVRTRFAALPLEAFDRVGEVLAADEQGAYFQLLRLAYGEGRNFCRAAKKDLLRRLGLSERRLGRVLGALVLKRFVRPLHRDNRGTLFRVYLPAEAFGEPLGDDVLFGRASLRPVSGAPEGTEPEAPPVGSRGPTPPRAELVRELALARGRPDALAEAADELAALERDGATPRQLAACVRAAAERARTVRPSPERGVLP